MGTHQTYQDDIALVERCLEQDKKSLATLRDNFHDTLFKNLTYRGATPVEAEDILEDVWSDCIARPSDGRSLLSLYSGRAALKTWLSIVTLNRYLERKGSYHDRNTSSFEEHQPSYERIHSSSTENFNDEACLSLKTLFDRTLTKQLRGLDVRIRLVLRLVYIESLSRQEVAKMFGWSNAKMTRKIQEALRQIEVGTLREIKKVEPRLTITWEDILEISENISNHLI